MVSLGVDVSTKRAWSFLIVSEVERQFEGNLGYGDVLGERYVWDNTVPRHRDVNSGDLAVLRDRERILGLGWIDVIDSNETTKLRRRCPKCRNTSFKARKNKSPRYKCSSCSGEFDVPSEEVIPVTVYSAEYAATWRAVEHVPAVLLAEAYRTGSKQHSIRELRLDVVERVLSYPANLGPNWWSGVWGTELPSGHRTAIRRVRNGQAGFRDKLLRRFGTKCAISGTQPEEVLDAAHLYRYCDLGEHDVRGGLLLRTDLHRLFDRWLLAVDTNSWTIRVAPRLRSYPQFASLEGQPLNVPQEFRPHSHYLDAHLAWAVDAWGVRESVPIPEY
jgi:ribosomal protein S27AE